MSNATGNAIGLDIGGTKIAGAIFGADGSELSRHVVPTPKEYPDFLESTLGLIAKLEEGSTAKASVGIGLPGAVSAYAGPLPTIANISCLSGKDLAADLAVKLQRPVRLANDADCAALSEATDGAGAGHRAVFGLILGTGVGGGLVIDQKLYQGANGLAGEFGHLPLPHRIDADGPVISCACGQSGCIDKSASGPALLRRYHQISGKVLTASPQVAELAKQGDKEALAALDDYFTTVAKALVTVLHMFDPDIIVACGGLSAMPGLIEAVPQRWGRFTMIPYPRTKFAVARHGAMSGLRGAAWLGRAA